MIPLYLQHPVKRNMKNLARVILPILLGVVWVLLLGFWLMPEVGAVPPAAPLLQPGNPVTDPPRNTHTAPATTTVSITYDEEINGATVSTRTFAVHAMQTGLLTQTYGISGGTISLTPTRPFKPDELVQVSATTRTLGSSGQGPLTPTVWQFRAAVTGGSGVFTDSGQRLGHAYSRDVVLGDVDGDGDLDAVVANGGSSQASQGWRNDGSGVFVSDSGGLGISTTYAIALGDLDGDGDLDAFVVNRGEPSQVWRNDGRGAFTDSGQSLGDDSFSQAVALGDVDGDGDLDALVANVGPNQVWLNNGAGVFTSSGPGLGNADSRDVALGDVDGDGDLDAFFANQGTSVACNEVWLNDRSGRFTRSDQCLNRSDSQAVALGDVDGDGDLDALVANVGPNQVWLNDGAGVFTDSGQGLGNADSQDVALGDLDGDGDLDAFVANQGNITVCNEVWLNDGSGVFTDSHQCLGHSPSRAVALGDLKPDGALDAFVANYGDAGTVWWAVLHPAISLNKTVGTDTGLCAPYDAIGVTTGAQVVYCYRVTNVGDVALTTHILTDTRLGRILSGSHHLAPGATWFTTTTSVLTRTTVNTATWVASAGDHVATATDSAMVAVIVPAVQINQIIPNPSWFLEDVLFDGSGTPTTTTSLLKEYEWTRIPASATCGSPITTLLGTAARIRDNTIPVGTHRICLRGKTYDDVWSNYVMTTTTVRPDRWAFSDIAVGPKSVSFWKDPSAQDDPVYNPDVGDTVYVKVEVHNISIHNTPDTVTVSFYTGTITASLHGPIAGTRVGTNTIDFIAAQTSGFVTIPWTISGEVGYRPFAVDIEYTENIPYFAQLPLPPYTEPYSETDYTNNRVIGAIPVGHVTGTYGISVTAGVLPIHQSKLYAGYPAYVSGRANYAWDVLLATMGATTTIRVSDWSGVAVACWKTYRTWTTSPLGDYRVTIPLPYKPGVYRASVTVDDGNLSGAQVVTFTVSEPPKPLPDLYIERFSVLLSGPNTYVRTWDDYTFQRVYHRSRLFGVQNEPIAITARVQNGGNLPVNGIFTITFYDGTPGDGGTRIGTETINGLAAGAAKRIEHVWTPARTGIHVIQAVVDEANQIEESNETNNYDDYYYTYQACFNDVASRRCHDAAHRDIIEVRVANPDLRALGLNYVEPDLGDLITMTVNIHNIGHREIITPGGVFTFTVYDGYPNVGVASTRMLTAPGELGPTRAVSLYRGTHRTFDVVWNTGYTGTLPGLHHICVEVDTGAEIAEEIEENNVNCWDLYVFPDEADLYPYELTYSNNCPLPNETITITAHFMNMGAQVFTPTEVVTFYHTSITPTHVTATATISGPIAGHRGTGTTITQVMAPGSHGTTYIFVEYIKTNGSYNLGPHRYARRLNVCKMPPPNLRILSGDIHVDPRSPTPDEPVSVAVDVANVSQSSIATATDFIVEFHTSGPTAGYHELGQPRTIASLGPGMITTVLASTPFAMADKFYAVQASAWPRVEQGDEYYGDNETTTSIVRGNVRMLALTVTVGTIPGVCASTDAITVYTGTLVFYCYQMTNQGEVHLGVHDVYDDRLGGVLSGYPYDLSQGETFTWVQQVNLTRTTASTATWVASAAPYTFIGTDTAIVNVKRIYLPVVRKASGN